MTPTSISVIRHSVQIDSVSRQLVYGHFVYDTTSTDISSTMTFLAEFGCFTFSRHRYKETQSLEIKVIDATMQTRSFSVVCTTWNELPIHLRYLPNGACERMF